MRKAILFLFAAGLLFVSCGGVKDKTFDVNGVSFTMVKVDGGTFRMGCTAEQGCDCENDENPVHSVTLSDYYIGETEVTQALWKAVMGTTLEQQTQKAYNYYVELGASEDLAKELTTPAGVGPDFPMYNISYDEVVNEFIPELNRLTGQNFRLPTEAEWEYAARGGNKSKGFKYAGSDNADEVAWYLKNSGDSQLQGNDDTWDWAVVLNNGCRTHPVKTKNANELGLYDMSGNVWEWCSNWYGEYYAGAQTDPQGPSAGSFRVFRGGSWSHDAGFCRVSNRDNYAPDFRHSNIGFRLALKFFPKRRKERVFYVVPASGGVASAAARVWHGDEKLTPPQLLKFYLKN